MVRVEVSVFLTRFELAVSYSRLSWWITVYIHLYVHFHAASFLAKMLQNTRASKGEVLSARCLNKKRCVKHGFSQCPINNNT